MIFLSLEAQHSFQTFQHVLFGIATALNCISLICMIKVTPPHQAKIRNYVLAIQATVILNSIYMDVILLPIPLLPEPAMICMGVLCETGISLQILIAGLVITYIWLNEATVTCCFFRHQTLLPGDSRLSKTKSRTLIVVGIISPFALTAAYAATPFDPVVINSEISWAEARGPLIVHQRSNILLTILAGSILFNIGLILVVLSMFQHMYQNLYANKQRSPSTVQKIRKSLIIFFIQTFIPFLMLNVPFIYIFSVVLCDCIPFEVNFSICTVLIFHPIFHNVIVLGITPTYRNCIASLFRKAMAAKGHSNVVVTISRQNPVQGNGSAES